MLQKTLPVISLATETTPGLAPALGGPATGTRVLLDSQLYSPIIPDLLPITVALTNRANVFTLNQTVSRTDNGAVSSPADLQVSVTYAQSGTAGAVNLGINRIETHVGTGVQAFERYQVNAVDKWVLNNQGQVTVGSWRGTPVDIAYGGTNAATRAAAINNLLPAQGSNANKFLSTNGTDVSWTTVVGGSAGPWLMF